MKVMSVRIKELNEKVTKVKKGILSKKHHIILAATVKTVTTAVNLYNLFAKTSAAYIGTV